MPFHWVSASQLVTIAAIVSLMNCWNSSNAIIIIFNAEHVSLIFSSALLLHSHIFKRNGHGNYNLILLHCHKRAVTNTLEVKLFLAQENAGAAWTFRRLPIASLKIEAVCSTIDSREVKKVKNS